MTNVTVTSVYGDSVDVYNVEYAEVEDGILSLLDEKSELLALFAPGTWVGVVVND